MKNKKNNKELFYDSISDEWENFAIYNLETQKRIKVVFEELLLNIELKNKHFLDAGCGLGYFSKKAVEKKALVTGIDIGKNLINKCQKRVPKAKFLVAKAQTLPFKDNLFEIVLSTEVIEHVNNPKIAITELFRVSKPGGYIIITTPNKVFKPLFDFLSFVKIRPYQGNENWLFPWDLKKMIKKNKGIIKKEKYFNFIYPGLFEFLEKYKFLNYLMINQSFLVKKWKIANLS